jgi:phosphatidylethanolamine-binding protein (PEBP) family uncharacterized protein
MAQDHTTQLTGLGRKVLLGVLCAGMAIAGCGASRSTTTTSRSKRVLTASEPVPRLSIEVSIPTLLREGYIPERYTCDGADVSLPVRWSHIPSGTAELVIFAINLQPVHGRFFFDWALAGISATSQGISAGVLPPGAIVGRNSAGKVGYSICPAKGTPEEHYIVRVVALPHPLAAKPGFDAEVFYREAERSATAVGLGGGGYKSPGG